MALEGLYGHRGAGRAIFPAHGGTARELPVSRLLPRMGMKVTFDPHPAPLLIACGPFLCSPLCQCTRSGFSVALPCESQAECTMPLCPSEVFVPGTRGLRVRFSLGVLFLRTQGSGMQARGRRGSGSGFFEAPETPGVAGALGPPDGSPFLPFLLGVRCPQLPPTLLLAAEPSRSGSIGGGPEPAGPLLC